MDRRLLALQPRARAWLVVGVLSGAAGVAVLLAQLGVVALVVADVFIEGGTLAGQWPLLGLAFLLLAVRALLVAGRELAARRAAEHAVGALRRELTGRVLELGPAWLSQERSGELGGVLTAGLETLDEYVSSYLPVRWAAMVVPLIVLVVVLLLDPPTVLVLLLTGPLLLLLLIVIGGRTGALTERRFLEMRALSAFFLDILRGLPTLRMFGRSREQVETLRHVSARYGDATMEVLRSAFQTSLVLEWGATIAIALVAVEVGLRLLEDAIAFERALTVLLVTPEFFLPLRLLAVRFHQGTAGKAAMTRAFDILDAAPGGGAPGRVIRRGGPESGPAVGPAPVFEGPPAVRFEAVTFRYPGREEPALAHLDLEIPAGRSLAIVGASGAGKSTTASMLLRFIEPEAGRVSADGRLVGDVPLPAWRALIAWVPQRPHLFAGSVLDNLRLARPGADEAAVLAASRAANADAFIERLPEGYDTSVGEGGARLSGGQRQRIAIARAFLRDAALLVLDEPTSYQDDESEAAIADALARLSVGRTVLLVAHRLRLAARADQVAVLDAGRVIEVGPPAALLAAGGAYARLVADAGPAA